MMRFATKAQIKKVSFLLATSGPLLLTLASDDLAQHHHAIAVHERDARKALAILECVANERLLWLEAALRHFVRLERVRLLHLLAASLLAHLPLELGDPARRAAAPYETDGRVPNLDLVGDVEHLDLRVEFARLPKSGVLLVDHHIAGARHVVLVQALDVQTHVVSRVGKIDTLVVHLYSENLASARVRCCVRRQEDNLLTWLYHTLLDASCEDVTNALDLVDPRNGHPHGRTRRPLG